jgi:hypothetical protein
MFEEEEDIECRWRRWKECSGGKVKGGLCHAGDRLGVMHGLWLVKGRLTNNTKVRAPRKFAFHILYRILVLDSDAGS